MANLIVVEERFPIAPHTERLAADLLRAGYDVEKLASGHYRVLSTSASHPTETADIVASLS